MHTLYQSLKSKIRWNLENGELERIRIRDAFMKWKLCTLCNWPIRPPIPISLSLPFSMCCVYTCSGTIWNAYDHATTTNFKCSGRRKDLIFRNTETDGYFSKHHQCVIINVHSVFAKSHDVINKSTRHHHHQQTLWRLYTTFVKVQQV